MGGLVKMAKKIEPGQVVILARGAKGVAGTRVVCISGDLSGGRIAVCGLNGRLIPEKPGHCIPTSTKIKIDSSITKKFGREYFDANSKGFKAQFKNSKKNMSKFMEGQKNIKPNPIPESDEKEVIAAIDKACDGDLKEYLNTPFKVNPKFGLVFDMNF